MQGLQILSTRNCMVECPLNIKHLTSLQKNQYSSSLNTSLTTQELTLIKTELFLKRKVHKNHETSQGTKIIGMINFKKNRGQDKKIGFLIHFH